MNIITDRDIHPIPLYAVHQGQYQIVIGYKFVIPDIKRGNLIISIDGFYHTFENNNLILTCLGELPKKFLTGIPKGSKVAQLVINKIENYASIEEVVELSTSDRGEGGFGSTGVA